MRPSVAPSRGGGEGVSDSTDAVRQEAMQVWSTPNSFGAAYTRLGQAVAEEGR